MEIRLHPVFDRWIVGLRDREAKARIAKRLLRAELGNLGDVKAIGGGVSEMRIDYGGGYRLYLGRDGEAMIILLCGGDKSSQDHDIKIAKELWRRYKQESRS